jgi:hypothetical protein
LSSGPELVEGEEPPLSFCFAVDYSLPSVFAFLLSFHSAAENLLLSSVFVLAVILSEAKDPETDRTAPALSTFSCHKIPIVHASPQIIFTQH